MDHIDREDHIAFYASVVENLDPDKVALLMDGSIEVCPSCMGLSAHRWDDTNAYDEFEDGIIPVGFVPAKGTVAHIGAASAWEWTCGHCGAHHVEVGSPLDHPCYTHEAI